MPTMYTSYVSLKGQKDSKETSSTRPSFPGASHGLLSLLVFHMDLFVCVEVLRPSQPIGVMSSAVSLPNHTFTGQA